MMNGNNQNTNGAIDYMKPTENTNNYSATRTSVGNNTRNATGTNNTFLGMTTNAWTWLIIAAVAAVIVALIWYYASTNARRTNYYDDNDNRY